MNELPSKLGRGFEIQLNVLGDLSDSFIRIPQNSPLIFLSALLTNISEFKKEDIDSDVSKEPQIQMIPNETLHQQNEKRPISITLPENTDLEIARSVLQICLNIWKNLYKRCNSTFFLAMIDNHRDNRKTDLKQLLERQQDEYQEMLNITRSEFLDRTTKKDDRTQQSNNKTSQNTETGDILWSKVFHAITISDFLGIEILNCLLAQLFHTEFQRVYKSNPNELTKIFKIRFPFDDKSDQLRISIEKSFLNNLQ